MQCTVMGIYMYGTERCMQGADECDGVLVTQSVSRGRGIEGEKTKRACAANVELQLYHSKLG